MNYPNFLFIAFCVVFVCVIGWRIYKLVIFPLICLKISQKFYNKDLPKLREIVGNLERVNVSNGLLELRLEMWRKLMSEFGLFFEKGINNPFKEGRFLYASLAGYIWYDMVGSSEVPFDFFEKTKTVKVIEVFKLIIENYFEEDGSQILFGENDENLEKIFKKYLELTVSELKQQLSVLITDIYDNYPNFSNSRL